MLQGHLSVPYGRLHQATSNPRPWRSPTAPELQRQKKKKAAGRGKRLSWYHNHTIAKPETKASIPESQIHSLHPVPSFHSKYQATSTLSHRESMVFLRNHSHLGSWELEEPMRQVIFVSHFFPQCAKLLRQLKKHQSLMCTDTIHILPLRIQLWELYTETIQVLQAHKEACLTVQTFHPIQ